MSKYFAFPALLVAMSLSTAAFGNLLTLNAFQGFGGGAFTVTGASTTGASITYDANNGRNDIGLAAVINSGSQTPFTQIGDTLTYNFDLGGISAANNNTTPLYRVGFDFGSTAALRYETSSGTQPNLRFGFNTDGNPFASGTVTANETDWSPFANQALRFDDGNQISAVLSLELVGLNGANFDYLMTVTYTSGAVNNTKSHTFTNVNGNQVVSLFHATNSAGMVAGDAYTISNASLQFTAVPEPSTYAMLAGMVSVGMLVLRRRRSA